MTRILLINPNTSRATTAMMLAIARRTAPAGVEVVAETAATGVAMILDPVALAAASAGVLAMGLRHATSVTGMIVAAFGDPGLADLHARLTMPVCGIAEAAMTAAAAHGRFGIATVTPLLRPEIDDYAARLGLAARYTGTRLTDGDPEALAADPARMVAALGDAVERCIRDDGAQAVVIGGGPLGEAATALAPRFAVPVVAPIPAAIRLLLSRLTPD